MRRALGLAAVLTLLAPAAAAAQDPAVPVPSPAATPAPPAPPVPQITLAAEKVHPAGDRALVLRGRAYRVRGTMTPVAAVPQQVELRILAHLSGEPVLRSAFERGEDVHRATAAEVLGRDAASLSKTERDRAKAVNFGIVYGISSFGLSANLMSLGAIDFGLIVDGAVVMVETVPATVGSVGRFSQKRLKRPSVLEAARS